LPEFTPETEIRLPSTIAKQLLQLHESAVICGVEWEEADGVLTITYKYPVAAVEG
jgi:hypothetical protein